MIRRRLKTCQRRELKEAIQIDIQLQALVYYWRICLICALMVSFEMTVL